MSYRLGLDLGTNSIGWAAIKLDADGEPCGVLDIGVRVFPDGRTPSNRSQKGPSLAVERRLARGARRRRDRYEQRRSNLLQALITCGLMPTDHDERQQLTSLDPYVLRAKVLDDPLPRHELGRALFHLNQRRGFKSNRKTDSAKKEQSGGKKRDPKAEMSALRKRIEASRADTLGKFLAPRRAKAQPVRGRPGEGLYPDRDLYEAEFDKIRKAQKPHQALSAAQWDTLHDIIFRQRPLKPQLVGKCTRDPARDPDDAEGFRCPWAHPLAQRFRIWQEVRNLEIRETGLGSRCLSKEEGDQVAQALIQQNTVSFARIRKLLHLNSGSYFNLESQKRKHLLGDETAAKLAHKDILGKTWRKLPLDQQIEIVERLLDEKEEDKDVIEWLTTRHAELDRAAAEHVVGALLPAGHCRLGLRAIRKILPCMKAGQNYPDAAKAAGYDHARLPSGELSPTGRLPYYGEWLKDHLAGSGKEQDPPEKRWGRYPNPTVHVGLNQLRRVVNALIAEYGRPDQVVIELVRDLKLSKKRRDELDKDQAANQAKNEQRDKELRKLGLDTDYDNRLKLRLWKELNPENALDRRCPFTGEVIGKHRLFFSGEVEVEHLIPWADSWDDSAANKVVCLRKANQVKGQQTPHEAFGETPEWDSIRQRAAKLPREKQWRFAPDARQRFERQRGFLARQLNETGWLARLAKEYLAAVVPQNNIRVSPGRLTAMIRAKWRLNYLLPGPHGSDAKNRTDHRHHAIDAFVVALTNRSLLNRMSRTYDATRAKITVPPPWDGFREELQYRLDCLIVSHKPDRGTPGQASKNAERLSKFKKRKDIKAVRDPGLRKELLELWDRVKARGGTSGQLHNETAYGLLEPAGAGPTKVVVRKLFATGANGWPQTRENLETMKDGELKKGVRDDALRAALLALWDQVHDNGGKPADFVKRVQTEGVLVNDRRQRVRRVRVVENLRVIPIKDRAGKPYKGYMPDSNEFADVWRMPPDKHKTWKIIAVPTFYANQADFDIERPHPAAKRLMRLYKNDMAALGQGASLRIVRVRKIEDGRVYLDFHHEANAKAKGYRPRTLKQQGFRVVRVDELGRVRDPGPRAP